MPRYKAHLVGGGIAFGIVYYAIFLGKASPILSLEWLCCALVGALFPDIDTQSKGRKMYYVFLTILALFFYFKADMRAIAYVGALMIMPLFFSHRGLTHSILFITIICLSVLCYTQIYRPDYCSLIITDGFFFLAGACSHIILDRLSTWIKYHLRYELK